MNPSLRNFSSEFIIKASRSSGKGGQNVNKVSTKVELSFDIQSSALLSDEEKGIIFEKLRARINKEGILKIVCQTERSQLFNKQIAIEKFYSLIHQCFVKKKKRIPTKVSNAAKFKRLKKKKIVSEKKQSRMKSRDW